MLHLHLHNNIKLEYLKQLGLKIIFLKAFSLVKSQVKSQGICNAANIVNLLVCSLYFHVLCVDVKGIS